ncbi:MAG: hypothetical protein WB762_10370 [Candidatus Sulfotelmatobacter sp.]
MKLATVFLMTLLGPLSRAQVAIQNPQHLPIPEQQVETLHHIICRVVAEEFHAGQGRPEGSVILVLGEDQERTIADVAKGTFTIYLKHWDEATFAISDMQLTVQRVVSHDRWERMAREVIRRDRQITPISANALK